MLRHHWPATAGAEKTPSDLSTVPPQEENAAASQVNFTGRDSDDG